MKRSMRLTKPKHLIHQTMNITIESDFGTITIPRLTIGLIRKVNKRSGVDLISAAMNGFTGINLTDVILYIIQVGMPEKTIEELGDAIEITSLLSAADAFGKLFENFLPSAVPKYVP